MPIFWLQFFWKGLNMQNVNAMKKLKNVSFHKSENIILSTFKKKTPYVKFLDFDKLHFLNHLKKIHEA